MLDDRANLGFLDPAALHTIGRRRRRAEHEQVTLANQPFSTGLIKNHSRVGETRNSERQAGGHIGFDDAGDDVDRRALGGDHKVNADRAGHLSDTGDRVLDITSGHHHEVGKFVNHDEHERETLIRERFAALVDLTETGLD